ncbi:cryptochrome/photolyase family protein [Actinophytocola oryzae]|uniref:Deoxyribodipyrimidine photolyase-related protein n=1 Tax=Actinophytocola oryzae TaxID=502181 RepID=A0A4R7W0W9_9PSEU|nr:cryptochrome/photolyase family protein [Actinophytocola oryzae]TDV56094.1 deoxyribodipyrimidine photolyase-related protein [Actinophytocola oryzae]
MSDRAPLWLFGDQLGRHFHGGAHADREVVLIESRSALGRHRYHRQKLHLVLYAMRRLAAELGDRATLIQAESYRDGLARLGRPVITHEPGSHAAARLVEDLAKAGVVQDILPTTGFALSKQDFAHWAEDRGRFLMEDFYRDQRRRFGVLLEPDGEPVGGRWNLDRDNREQPPRQASLGVPAPYRPQENEIDRQVRADLDELAAHGRIDPVGVDGPRLFAASHDEARRALDRFLDTRLATFGTHQDAMLDADWEMSHALLSVPLNLGLLDPLHVVRAAERRHPDGAPLNSVEGFVRQILGWREWIWHLYWHLGPSYLRRNALRAGTRLPGWWRSLDADQVTAQCLRTALTGVRDRGFVHHIQRLMVLGNHALQRGYAPRALTDWFATAFVDGFPWVMPANVIGMSQYADGGIVATKPYAAGGAYINRMSDSCRSCAFDPGTRVGERACPFTAGYWAFLDRNEPRLRANHRMAQPLRGLRRLSDLDVVVGQERDRESF